VEDAKTTVSIVKSMMGRARGEACREEVIPLKGLLGYIVGIPVQRYLGICTTSRVRREGFKVVLRLKHVKTMCFVWF